ncbi:restriction endonuclease [Virgibacillus ihumii]|uniref:restriction endonuclease n=1 Tax=Virgibacillus ihumii TaxID=2686091 RepID=UPI00157C3595|nr:restriction endonuclease [Virgibacillus ihumii]
MAGNMYQVEIKHDGLNKYRIIKGSDRRVVKQKALAQERQWEEMWHKKLEAERKKEEREKAAREKEEKKALAMQLTEEAEQQLQNIENTLSFTLTIDDKIDWESLKDTSEYTIPEPDEPNYVDIPDEPDKNSSDYKPKLNILDRFSAKRKENKIEQMDKLFEENYGNWELKKKQIIAENEEVDNGYKEQLQIWENEKQEFLQEQAEKNHAIDIQKENYLKKIPTAIVDYCDMVLTNSIYPKEFPQEFDIDFNPESKNLIVDYSLPAPIELPRLKGVKYVQSRDDFKEAFLSDSVFNKMYDNLLYQITLRSLHELFEADIISGIDSIVFNGWVNSIDKSTGNEVNSCVLSIQATKEEIMDLNLSQVDPKACFKNLKGIGSSKLHSLAPVAPIIKIDRNDPRFVSSYDLGDGLSESDNLAAMDWQDFEHLIRELFDKEFNQSGGEVNITRASRDGGVDAIAFDPDPIRGGKIVIQAKRYTNVVGVSAVRDLYGTVLNEGATKGILVSTADYGPDAYKFSKDKPITLLNGNNLLHMLQNHGYKAKIDLKEAKKVVNDQ